MNPLFFFIYNKPSLIPIKLEIFSFFLIFLSELTINKIIIIEIKKLMASIVNKCINPKNESPIPAKIGPMIWAICPETIIREFTLGKLSPDTMWGIKQSLAGLNKDEKQAMEKIMQPINGIEKKLNLIDIGIIRSNVNLKKSDIIIIFLWSYLSINTPANRPNIKAGK